MYTAVQKLVSGDMYRHWFQQARVLLRFRRLLSQGREGSTPNLDSVLHAGIGGTLDVKNAGLCPGHAQITAANAVAGDPAEVASTTRIHSNTCRVLARKW